MNSHRVPTYREHIEHQRIRKALYQWLVLALASLACIAALGVVDPTGDAAIDSNSIPVPTGTTVPLVERTIPNTIGLLDQLGIVA